MQGTVWVLWVAPQSAQCFCTHLLHLFLDGSERIVRPVLIQQGLFLLSPHLTPFSVSCAIDSVRGVAWVSGEKLIKVRTPLCVLILLYIGPSHC